MPSSTSASSPWRKFALTFLGTITGIVFCLWLFIIIIDPWGMLPLSLPFHRIPISTNARYSFPALAIDPQFNAAIFGNSTSRPLEPIILNKNLDTHFVNLSMNSSTPWEQEKLFNLFIKYHPHPKIIIFNTDTIWCFSDPKRANRPFPSWMYQNSRWTGYFKMANQYALQESFNQFLWLVGLKKQRYGSDGFTPLLPNNFIYSPQKVNDVFAEWDKVDNSQPNGRTAVQEALPRLERMTNKLPQDTIKIIFIPPFSSEFYGEPNKWTDLKWKSCKANIAKIANNTPNSFALDFAIPNNITQQRINFWDPIHYRPNTAKIVMNGIIQAILFQKELPDNQDRILGYKLSKNLMHQEHSEH